MKKFIKVLSHTLLITLLLFPLYGLNTYALNEDVDHFFNKNGSSYTFTENTVLYTSYKEMVGFDWENSFLVYKSGSLSGEQVGFSNAFIKLFNEDGTFACYYYPSGKPDKFPPANFAANTIWSGVPSRDYRGLVAHWKFDGDLKDSSLFGNNGSAVGKIEFVDAIFGKGAKFNGKSYIEVPDSTSLNLKDAFTFSFWVYKDDMRINDGMDVGVPYFEKNADPYGYWPYGMYEWWRYQPGVSYGYDGSSGDTHSEMRLDQQKWALVTSTYDGSTMKIFINDQLVKSELVNVTLDSSSAPLYIGFGNFMVRDNYFKGIMDDLKIYNTALTYEQVESLYNAGLAGPGKNLLKKPNRLVAYYRFEDNGNDSSIMKNNATPINANGGIKYIDGIAGKAAKFNGASYFEVKDSDSLDLDNFTISLWVNEDKTEERNPLVTKYGDSNNRKDPSYSLFDNYTQSGTTMYLGLFDEDDTYDEFSIEKPITIGKWYHYTATYDGKTVKIYINGTLVKTIQFDETMSHSSGPLWLGAFTDGSFFKGVMDELRIYNYALTPAEVKKLYSYTDKLESVPTVKGINLNTLTKGKNVQLKTIFSSFSFSAPTAAAPNGIDGFKNIDITKSATYKSSNIKVASVSTQGNIIAVGKGTATITVTYKGKTKTLTVVVK